MERFINRLAYLVVAVVLLWGGGLLALTWLQRPDLASNVSGYATLVPAIRANSAATGRAVALSGFGSAMMAVIADSIDTGQPSLYVVLQDSLRTATDTTWAVVDSVLVDSAAASNAAANWKELGYQGTGAWLRAIQRASGAATDSVATTVIILRGNCRRGPC